MKLTRFIVLALLVCSVIDTPTRAQDRRVFANLQVLPPDISNDSLGEIMLDNLRGLGLPRLEGRGCLFCHVGTLDQPRASWDYASDAKPMKVKARVMMAMVDAINRDHLSSLPSRVDEELRVTCYTCHAGRTDPRPLPALLTDAYDAGGVDSLTASYTALRARYFGADAYDFRTDVLSNIAYGLADGGNLESAIAVAYLNAEANPGEAEARWDWIRLRLERSITENGVEEALAELNTLFEQPDLHAAAPALLDVLGWRLYRTDRQDAAIALFNENHRRFPNHYTPRETLAFILWDTGRHAAAYEILEEWLRDHPDHDRARRLIINLRAREGGR